MSKKIIEVRVDEPIPSGARFIMPGRSQNVYTNMWGRVVKEQNATFFYEVVSEERSETPQQVAERLLKDFVNRLVDGDRLKVVVQTPPNASHECVLLMNPRDNNMLIYSKGVSNEN